MAKLEAELRAERDGLQRRLADWDAREHQLLEFITAFREMHALLAVVAELAADRALFAQQKLIRYSAAFALLLLFVYSYEHISCCIVKETNSASIAINITI